MDDTSTTVCDDSDTEYCVVREPSIRRAQWCLPQHTILSYGNNNCSSLENAHYSKAVMVVDVVWNMALVVVGVVGILSERPSLPLRVWVCGFVKRLESTYTIISSIRWLMGFYWILAGGQVLMQDSPRLYWLTVVFLAFDEFFIIFCIGMVCVILLAIFCCIRVLAVAYAVAVKKGASEDDIKSLPKYRYCQYGPLTTLGNSGNEQGMFGSSVGSSNSNSAKGRVLLPEDSGSISASALLILFIYLMNPVS